MSEVLGSERSRRSATAKRERCTADVRRRAIMDAAAEVFLERGYAGASIDSVVERAGGSKASVYALFGNKLGLLTALVAEGAESLGSSVGHDLDQPLEESLREFGTGFLRIILHPTRLALYRLVVGESGRLPELGDVFYRTGPEAVVRNLAEFFRHWTARGALEPGDPERLANYFIGALRGDLHFRALFNPTRAPTAKEVEEHVDFVVETFLREVRRRLPSGP